MDQPVKIIARFTAEGWHFWPDAPEHRAYRRQPHRHLFYIGVETEVSEDEREIDVHDLLDTAKSLFPTGDLGTQSCAGLGRHLGTQLAALYGRGFGIVVFEDNEVGAVVRVDPS